MNLSKVAFGLIAKELGIVFTTGYFQALAGQPIKKIEKKMVSREDMILICGEKSQYNRERNVLFIARDDRGNLVKTCYIDGKGDLTESVLFSGNYT